MQDDFTTEFPETFHKAMLRLFIILCLSAACLVDRSYAQQIHSHNDYEKAEPLQAALRNQAGSIEADVYLVDGKLMVAHEKQQIQPGRTLDSLYLKPIAGLFDKYRDKNFAGAVSKDRRYTFQLVIDVKDNGPETIKQLEAAIVPYRTCFDRAMNPLAVQLVISGNRPPIASWVDYPSYILFDGRPSELYDDETLKHVALISDTFRNYSRWDGNGDIPDKDKETLKRFIKRAHSQNKPIRFWASPDQPNAWKQLARLGIDYINTDKVEECAKVIK
ncbi:phosphatidylinositol-specific phospholipase C/glycerophosphodiester phosphodiesterase family protein [Larkinella soli]|uniref:phosphatidylinositol-specific phospholipase C/glycerophosphodiester phosphodiesterase family protein n=1 Tax=Larkinella soli TaxID=1770527 RepID=UPI001E2B7508|nr:phosphatidylinositol-specific phospholipase C/glycerophosphodiester phosphodiesterase family protein [Larkinella soli]